MHDINYLIEFENENTVLDFKAIQYSSLKFEDFLKDIISMANAKVIVDRHIIVGVHHKSNGDRYIVGIDEAVIDDAIYQELVHNNIEPEIQFILSPVNFKGKKLGVFRIFGCNNQPYMMKKDFGKLKIGDSFIRRGSHQSRVTRKDIDQFFNDRISNSDFTNLIRFYFDNKLQEISLTALPKLKFPSENAKKKIESLILKKEKSKENENGLHLLFKDQSAFIFRGTPYENRNIYTLKQNLKTVLEDYNEDDNYFFFELKSHKLNLKVYNDGLEYIEDASIELKFESKNVNVAPEIYIKPENGINFHNPIKTPSFEELNYPDVQKTDTNYIIKDKIGNLKHKIEQDVLEVPLRISFNRELISQTLILHITLYGKNLKNPIHSEMKIHIIE